MTDTRRLQSFNRPLVLRILGVLALVAALLWAAWVSRALTELGSALAAGRPGGWYIGLQDSQIVCSPLAHMLDFVDTKRRRPLDQWWLKLRPVSRAVAEQPPA